MFENKEKKHIFSITTISTFWENQNMFKLLIHIKMQNIYLNNFSIGYGLPNIKLPVSFPKISIDL